MKFLLPFLFYFLAINLPGQTTRAVIIGVSDYQNEAIPDLRFAHRDAEAFASYLRSKAGGGLSNDQVKLLTNEMATGGKMVTEIGWLLESSQEGDVAIIYFSGHGDMETNIKFNNGYLLPYDSPPKVYVMGAFPLTYLQAAISTLFTSKVQVLVVTDACHSGELAGSSVGGAQTTLGLMAEGWAIEVTILSCQSNEYSLEGEQGEADGALFPIT